MIAERTDFDTRSFQVRTNTFGRIITADETTVDRTHSLNSQSPRQTVRSRTWQVAKGWTRQERADRLQSGNAKRAWLLNLLDIA